MKTRLISVILVVLLVSPAVATPVVAQEETPTPTPDEEPSDAPDDAQNNSTDEQSGNQSDNQPSEAELLWQVIQESEDPADAEPQEIVLSLSETFWVQGAEFSKDDETVTITFVGELTSRVVLTDATGFERGAEVSRTESRGVTVPRGTYQITVPATVAADGNQAVTLSTGDGYIYRLSNGVVEEGSGWFDGRPLWEWFGYFTVVVLLGVVAHVVRRIWKMDHGAITTSEGAKIVGRLVAGMVDRPDADEDSAGDDE